MGNESALEDARSSLGPIGFAEAFGDPPGLATAAEQDPRHVEVAGLIAGLVDVAADQIVDRIESTLESVAAPVQAEFALLFHISTELDRILEIARWRQGGDPDTRPVERPLGPLSAVLAELRRRGIIRIDEVPLTGESNIDELSALNARSLLVVPMQVDDEETVLIVGSATRPIIWTDDYVAFVETVGDFYARALRRSRRDGRMFQAFTDGPHGVLITDSRGSVIDCNHAYRSITGQPDGGVLGLRELTHPDDREAVDRAYAAARGDLDPLSFTVRLTEGLPSTRWVRVRSGAVADPVTGSTGVVLSMEDATELHRHRDELARSEERFREAVEAMPALLIRVDVDGVVQMCNPEVSRLGPMDPDDMIGVNIYDLLTPELGGAETAFIEKIAEVLETGERVDAHFDLITASGLKNLEARAVPEFGEDGEIETVLIMALDVTERTVLAAEIEHAATHDTLTGIPSRSVLIEALQRHLDGEADPSPSVLFLDLDRFKAVNDSLGHSVGDEVLKIVAARIESHVREVDLAARIGGDEFAILIPALNEGDVVAMAERLREVIERPLSVGGVVLRQTVSIGIALATPDCTAESLLIRSDHAMYAAKQKGRNRCDVYDESLRDHHRLRLTLERELAMALERHELCMHYQPEVSLVDRSLLGVEALLRWNHPERGLIEAGEFIEVAERSGMMRDIGRFVIVESIEGFSQLRSALSDDEIGLRVNLSAQQLLASETVPQIANAIRRFELDPASVCFEITESTVMNDPHTAAETLRMLHLVGATIAMDDFGTGYSSLSNLRDYPVDWVKIDRSFVSDLGNDAQSDAIVAAVAGMASALGYGVVAEGVETEGQVQALLAHGVDRAQGFLFAPALAPEALIRWAGGRVGR